MTKSIQRTALFMLMCLLGGLQSLVSAAEQPTFSNGGTTKWYNIRFCKNGLFLTDNGTGRIATVENATGKNNQVWKLVGDANNFQLINKDGHYASPTGTFNAKDQQSTLRLQTSTSQAEKGFSLYNTKNNKYPGNFEIQYNEAYGSWLSKEKKSINQWAGDTPGTQLGFYKADDDNNAIEFVPAAKAVTVEGIQSYEPEDKHTLWYDQAAVNWMESSLPIGNGQFGASLFGGVARDEVQFNEKTLWSGTSTSVGTSGNGNSYGKYLNFGSLFIENRDNELGAVNGYHRDLNLTTATGTVDYTSAESGVKYKREYIASFPDKVVAIHLTATEANKISINVSLAKGNNYATETTYENGEGYFSGNLDVVKFNARMKVVNTGGNINTTSKGVEVTGADEVLILLAGGTDFDAYSPTYTANTEALASTIDNRLEKAALKGWDALYKAHVDDFQSFFNRATLNLTGSVNNIPTNQLVDNYRGGTAPTDLMLEELYFTYGRYLAISSSRGVDLPNNLQGIWNNDNNACWNSDIHANINVQMNYWPVETTNLTEIHEPLLNYIINMSNSPSWKKWAQESGQQRGWTCFTENNIYGGVGVWAHNYVIENAWYCTHLWQHYRYTLDKKFLAKAFPAMLSATQYWIDRLKLDTDNTYVCPNEYSPEQGPQQEDGVAHAQQLVYELYANTLDAIEILGENECGISAADLTKLRDQFSKLDKGLGIETYDGRWGSINGVNSGDQLLREWKYSQFYAGNNRHRHLSHMMCLYPFSQVTADSKYFTPVINSLKLRGDESTGWSMGWKINLWARALDGNHAHDILKLALRHSTSYGCDESKGGIYYNLYDSHAPFQIDGNFGACAGITEMLFQSHSGVLHFLPALPNVWTEGAVRGLKAVGNFTAGVEWKDSKATRITITNNAGQECKVQYPGIEKVLVTVNGTGIVPTPQGNNTVLIPSVKGDEIVIDFSLPASTGIQNMERDAVNAAIYDLEGRQVQSTVKGQIYIQNNRKFIAE